MHFQIYVPGARDVAPELEKVGLGDFVANAEAMRCDNGPDGKDGAIFAWWNPRCRQIGYRPNEQTWIPSQCGRYWSGIWNQQLPRSEELVRAQERGVVMVLGDGNPWLIPTIPKVEREMVIGKDGLGRMELPRRWEPIVMEQMRWIEFLRSNERFSLTEEVFWQFFDLSVMALRMNYRITREVAGHMRLFSTEVAARAFNAIVGELLNVGGQDGE